MGSQGKLLLIESYLINIEEMIRVENHHLATISITIQKININDVMIKHDLRNWIFFSTITNLFQKELNIST